MVASALDVDGPSVDSPSKVWIMTKVQRRFDLKHLKNKPAESQRSCVTTPDSDSTNSMCSHSVALLLFGATAVDRRAECPVASRAMPEEPDSCRGIRSSKRHSDAVFREMRRHRCTLQHLRPVRCALWDGQDCAESDRMVPRAGRGRKQVADRDSLASALRHRRVDLAAR